MGFVLIFLGDDLRNFSAAAAPTPESEVHSISEEARTLRCAALVAESIQMTLCPGDGWDGGELLVSAEAVGGKIVGEEKKQ